MASSSWSPPRTPLPGTSSRARTRPSSNWPPGWSRGDYPDAGAVVGVTRPEIGGRVRGILPEALFLSPGYGAQGGDASGVRSLLDRNGGGVLVNSSRGILYAYETSTADYRTAAREAARRTRDELRLVGAQV